MCVFCVSLRYVKFWYSIISSIIYSILQPDTLTQTHEAQARIRQWLELDKEGLASLVELASTRKT